MDKQLESKEGQEGSYALKRGIWVALKCKGPTSQLRPQSAHYFALPVMAVWSWRVLERGLQYQCLNHVRGKLWEGHMRCCTR